MLNWIKFLTVFLLGLTTVLAVIVFYNAYKPVAAANTVGAEKAIQSGQVTSINSIQIYNGTKSYVTVFGVNPKGEEIAVFVDESSDDVQEYEEVKLTAGITAKEAEKLVREELQVDKILSISLGIEEESPVWEVVFKNNNGKLNYVYLLFKDGHWWKKILNL